MATTIKLKNGSGAPAASDLVQGEPAIDLTNKRLYTENASGAVIEVGSNPSSLSIAGTAVTATAAELNILDGVTSTAAELNILDGVTSTAAELNILDGVTSTTAELNILDGVTSTAAELNILDGVTSTAAELNILDGVTSTTAELNILDGVTSTTAELNILDGVTSTAAELNILDGVTSTTAELNILDGVTSTATELNVLDGVTAFVDEDNMASDSATSIPSQQSVKAYVDSQVASSDTLAELTDTNITSPADASLLFYDTGTSKWIDNAVSGDITIADTGVAAIGSGVIINADVKSDAAIAVSKTALVAGTGITLSTNTLNVDASQTQITAVGTIGTGVWQGTAVADAYVANDLTISGGTVNNTVIGGSTPAAGTFSALVANSLTYPTSDGSNGQAIITNGSGTLSFGDVSGGGGITYVTKTANYTMSAGEGVIANTAGGTFTITLPASPSTGDQVIIADGNAWATTNLTVGRNSSTIEGVAADLVMDVSGISVTMVYDGSTWQLYPQTGTSPSLGIDDNATSTALTIDGSGNVGVGISSSLGAKLHVDTSGAGLIISNTTTKVRIDSDGVKFGTDTAAANALDDYEEGTFTPTFSPTSGSFGSLSYSVQTGYYTKIGDVVTAHIRIVTSGMSIGSAGSYLVIDGFPYAAHGSAYQAGTIGYAYNFSSIWPSAMVMANGSARSYLYTVDRVNNSETVVPSNLSTGTTYLECSVTYKTT